MLLPPECVSHLLLTRSLLGAATGGPLIALCSVSQEQESQAGLLGSSPQGLQNLMHLYFPRRRGRMSLNFLLAAGPWDKGETSPRAKTIMSLLSQMS